MLSPVNIRRDESGMSSVRVNWQVKTVLPVAFVLLNGLLLFLMATVSLRNPERHQVLIVAGTGAVAICAAVMIALAYFIQRPMVELQEKIARVGEGDLDVSVNFAKRNDEIGDLGRNFNRMLLFHRHRQVFNVDGKISARLARPRRPAIKGSRCGYGLSSARRATALPPDKR